MEAGLVGVIAVLRRVNLAAEAAIRPIAWILVGLMLLTVVFSVVVRETPISAPWTEPVILILLPVLAFVVAPVAYRRAENVALDMFVDVLPPRMARIHMLLIHLCLFFVILIALDLTTRKIGIRPVPTEIILGAIGMDVAEIRPFKAPMRIQTIGLEWRYVYMVMPLSMLLMLIVNLELILREVLALLSPGHPLAGPERPFDEDEAAVQRAE